MHTKAKKSRPLNRAERRNASIPGRLSGWESHLRATGGKVPDRPNHPGEPYYHAIGQAIGVSGQAVKKYANRIEKLAADIGFEPCEPETRKDPQPVMPRLTRYFDSLRASGKKVPVNIAHPDQPDFALIGREIEVDSWVLRAGHFLYRKVILEVVAELGLEKIEPMAIGDAPITIAELEGAIRRDCDSGVTDNDAPMTEKQRRGANSNTSWALNRLAGSSYAASLSAAARPALDAAIAALSGKPGEDRRWLAELKKCALALDRIEKDGLPVSLAAALNFAIGRSGLPRAAIAREIDIHEVVLADWTCGRRNPCRAALTKLAALEKYLCLSPRALTIRYRSTARGPKVVDPKGRTRRTSPGAASATAGRKRGKDREPDSLFPRDWPLERDPDGKLIYTHQSAWPEALRRERDQFMLFRSVAKAPLGMTRNGDLWSPGTTSMRDSEIGRLFSDIATKYKEFEGKPELLTFALFAFPLFLASRRSSPSTSSTSLTCCKSMVTSWA